MPKRKRGSNREHAKRKIKKLLRLLSSDSDDSSPSVSDYSDDVEQSDQDQIQRSEEETVMENDTQPTQIDEEMMNLLGEDPTVTTKSGPALKEELVNRWSAILINGLDKESRRALLEKYPFSSNCPSLKAPILNEEISESLAEIVNKQDSFLARVQDHVGNILSAIGIPMTDMITKGEKDNTALPILIDVGKMLTDLHHSMSIHRKYLIGPSLNLNVKKAVEKAELDGFLYGANLGDRIKALQSIKKTSSELMRPSKPKTFNLNSKRLSYNPARQKSAGGRKDYSQSRHQGTSKDKRSTNYKAYRNKPYRARH